MKLVMTLLVRDEEDIVEDHLVYHLNQGVDFVVATDNRSVDGTRDVLDRFQRLGYVEVIDEPDDTYDQWRWVTRMARRAAIEHGAFPARAGSRASPFRRQWRSSAGRPFARSLRARSRPTSLSFAAARGGVFLTKSSRPPKPRP